MPLERKLSQRNDSQKSSGQPVVQNRDETSTDNKTILIAQKQLERMDTDDLDCLMLSYEAEIGHFNDELNAHYLDYARALVKFKKATEHLAKFKKEESYSALGNKDDLNLLSDEQKNKLYKKKYVELRKAVREAEELHNAVKDSYSTDVHFKGLSRSLEEKEAQVAYIKKLMNEELSNVKVVRVFDDSQNAINFVLSILNQSRKILSYLGDSVLILMQAVFPFNLILGGISSVWDSIKVAVSKLETGFSRPTKIIMNAVMIGLSVAAVFVAPVVAIALTFVMFAVGFLKDTLYPFIRKREMFKKHQYGLDTIAGELKKLDKTDVSRYLDDKNQIVAHGVENAKTDLLVIKATLKDKNLSDEDKKKFVYKKDLLIEYTKLAAQYKKRNRDYERKRFNFVSDIVGMVAVAFCFIPFPPIQILGATMLAISAVVSIVRRHDWHIKAANWFSSLFEKKTNLSDQRSTHSVVADKLTAAQKREPLLVQESEPLLAQHVAEANSDLKLSATTLETPQLLVTEAAQDPVKGIKQALGVESPPLDMHLDMHSTGDVLSELKKDHHGGHSADKKQGASPSDTTPMADSRETDFLLPKSMESSDSPLSSSVTPSQSLAEGSPLTSPHPESPSHSKIEHPLSGSHSTLFHPPESTHSSEEAAKHVTAKKKQIAAIESTEDEKIEKKGRSSPHLNGN